MVDLNALFSIVIPYTDITIVQILTALIILVVGWTLTRVVLSTFKKRVEKTKLPALIVEFLARFLSILLYVMVILLAVGALGFQVNSVFMGLSAIIGLILGFGMQDTMGNLIAGVWIAALRPIDKEEFVDINGKVGKVSAVGILATELLTFDNKFITIPNNLVWGTPIINFTRMPTRRVDVNVGISYSSDVSKAVSIANDLMKGNAMVMDDPAPAVVTIELADSSVNLQLRAWSSTDDYWTVKNDLTNGILNAYRDEGVEIPFPQMDVHLTKD